MKWNFSYTWRDLNFVILMDTVPSNPLISYTGLKLLSIFHIKSLSQISKLLLGSKARVWHNNIAFLWWPVNPNSIDHFRLQKLNPFAYLEPKLVLINWNLFFYFLKGKPRTTSQGGTSFLLGTFYFFMHELTSLEILHGFRKAVVRPQFNCLLLQAVVVSVQEFDGICHYWKHRK